MSGALPRNRGNRSTNRVGATVSRRLRAAGWNVSPSARRHHHPGVFVRCAGDFVSVLVDTGLDSGRTADGIRDAVTAWPQVSGAEVTSDGDAFWVRFSYRPQQP
ncbi:hypothetical protein ACH3XX_20085 [Streptomyces scabiei]|uniref:hypothetical protein n=1 Tax=Streptomyces scabiei TaxID=1930 RepID=UPI0037A1546E